MSKGFLPIGVAILLLAVRVPVPLPASTALLIGAMIWIIFVLGQDVAGFVRINRLHEAYMKATGVDTNLISTLGDRTLWARSAKGMTLRQFMAARRQSPVAAKGQT